MFAILYKTSQIVSLARWNVICIVLSISFLYYAINWTIGLSPLILILLLCSLTYAWFIKFNGTTCTNKRFVTEDIKPVAKSVLITGCDTGFGFHIAKRLSKRGFQVFACCLFPFENGGQELSQCSNIHTLQMDVSSEEDIGLALEFVEHNLGENGELWAIINNAGINLGSQIQATPIEEIAKVLDVNLIGNIRVTKAFLPLLQKSQGRIINVASAAGRCAMPGCTAYSVSKNGIIWFSDCLRLEVAKSGISVITIEPWVYKTNLSNPASISSYIEEKWKD